MKTIKVITRGTAIFTMVLDVQVRAEKPSPYMGGEVNLVEAPNGAIARAEVLETASPVPDGYFHKAPFKFEGTLKRLHFKYLNQQ